MSELAKTEQPNEIVTIEGGILEIIARAARDPSVDIDKMERLLAMQERVIDRNAKAEFTAAKLTLRPELPEITMKGHIVIRDKNNADKIIQDTPFARFEDIHEAVMPVLTRHGFDLSFKNGMAPDGKVRVTTILSHIGGHSDETYFDLPHDSSGSKNAVQAVGSSTSYAKRYGVLSILNIRVVGEDDNAVEAGRKPCLSTEQRNEILTALDEVDADKRKFAEFLGVDSIADILASDYPKAKAAIEAKRKSAKK